MTSSAELALTDRLFRELLAEGKLDYFVLAGASPGLSRSLHRALRELRLDGLTGADIRPGSFLVERKGREIALLLGRYERALEADGLLDLPGLLTAAVKASTPAPIGPAWVLCPADTRLSPARSGPRQGRGGRPPRPRPGRCRHRPGAAVPVLAPSRTRGSLLRGTLIVVLRAAPGACRREGDPDRDLQGPRAGQRVPGDPAPALRREDPLRPGGSPGAAGVAPRDRILPSLGPDGSAGHVRGRHSCLLHLARPAVLRPRRLVGRRLFERRALPPSRDRRPPPARAALRAAPFRRGPPAGISETP